VTTIPTGDYSNGPEAIVTCDIAMTTSGTGSGTTDPALPADTTFSAFAAVTYKVYVECVPTSKALTGTPTHTVAVTGTSASITLTGLIDGELYHWTVYASDGTTTSKTVSYGGNPETDTDFICGNPPPTNQPPIISAPGQFEAGGTIAIPTGGSVVGTQVYLKAMLNDDGNSSCLEVELAFNGAAFSGTPTYTSPLQANGQATIIAVLPLGNWAWKCRARDAQGLTSNWMSFDVNPDTAPDFTLVAPGGGGGSSGNNYNKKSNTSFCPWGIGGSAGGMHSKSALIAALAVTLLAMAAFKLRP